MSTARALSIIGAALVLLGLYGLIRALMSLIGSGATHEENR